MLIGHSMLREADCNERFKKGINASGTTRIQTERGEDVFQQKKSVKIFLKLCPLKIRDFEKPDPYFRRQLSFLLTGHMSRNKFNKEFIEKHCFSTRQSS